MVNNRSVYEHFKTTQYNLHCVCIFRVETSVDGPMMNYQSNSPQPISPPIYYRDKTKPIAQGMHSPNRNTMVTMQTNTPKSSLQSINVAANNLNKSLSTSATTLTSDEKTHASQQQQPLSPPYYHAQAKISPPVRSSEIPPSFLSSQVHYHDTSSLRRTVSSVSSAKQMLHSPGANSHHVYKNVSPAIEHHHNNNNPNNNNNNSNNNTSVTSDIHIESPKNMTVVQPAKFQPYKEETKPFEMSDFYKYSTKFRQKNTNVMPSEQNSPQLPPKNVMHRHMHSTSMSANTIPSHNLSTAPYSIQNQ